MSRLVDCWKAVETAIAAATWSQPVSVHRSYTYEFDRADGDNDAHVFLVFDEPRTSVYVNKKYNEEDFRLGVVVRQQIAAGQDDLTQGDAAIELAEEVTDWMGGRTFDSLYKVSAIEWNEEYTTAQFREGIFDMAFIVTIKTIQQTRT